MPDMSFADAPGNLFNALGKLGLLIKQERTGQTAQNTNYSHQTNGANVQFKSEQDVQALIESAYLGILNALSPSGGLAQQVAAAYLNRLVFRSNPRIAQTLSQLNVEASLRELDTQMRRAGASIRQHTNISATPAIFTSNQAPTGDGIIVASVRRPSDGRILQHVIAENLEVAVTNDSYTGGATEGNEGLEVTGTGSEDDVFAFNWPLGSDATLSLSACDGSQDNQAENLLTNSGFDAFTGNTPDHYTVISGTPGTHLFAESSILFGTGKALRVVGDGSTLIEIQQAFDNGTTGTVGSLDPLTQYASNTWLRRGGSAITQGTMIIDWVDANGVVINDEAGTPNSHTIDLTGLSTVYTPYNTAFRAPRVLPVTAFQRWRWGTGAGNALNNGGTVYVDRGGLAEMQQLDTGQIYLASFSGSIPFTEGDVAVVTVTNERGGSGSLDTFLTLLYRLFPEVREVDFIPPYSTTPTVLDSIIG